MKRCVYPYYYSISKQWRVPFVTAPYPLLGPLCHTTLNTGTPFVGPLPVTLTLTPTPTTATSRSSTTATATTAECHVGVETEKDLTQAALFTPPKIAAP
eukprot:357586-Chlamydomonas_euryale.AAC.3